MADQSPPASPRRASPPPDSSSAVSVGSNGGAAPSENRKRKMEEEDSAGNTPAAQTLILKIDNEPENPNPNPNAVGDNKRRLVDDPNPNSNPNPNPQPKELFKCNFCHRAFSSPQALGGHQNAHKQDRAFLQHCQRLMNQSPDQFGYVNIPMSYDHRYYNLVPRSYPTLGLNGAPVYGRALMGQPVYGRPQLQWATNNPGVRPGTPRPLALPYYAPNNDGGRRIMGVNIEQGHVGTSSPATSGGGGGNEVPTRDLLRIEEEKKELDLSLKL